jgi:hypothetical protein
LHHVAHGDRPSSTNVHDTTYCRRGLGQPHCEFGDIRYIDEVTARRKVTDLQHGWLFTSRDRTELLSKRSECQMLRHLWPDHVARSNNEHALPLPRGDESKMGLRELGSTVEVRRAGWSVFTSGETVLWHWAILGRTPYQDQDRTIETGLSQGINHHGGVQCVDSIVLCRRCCPRRPSEVKDVSWGYSGQQIGQRRDLDWQDRTTRLRAKSRAKRMYHNLAALEDTGQASA